MRTFGLRFSLIISSVFSSCASPRSERYSHCTGHDDAVGGRQGVDRQQAQRWRRVDEDVVVAVLDLHERFFQRALAPDGRRQRQLGARQVDARRGDVDLAALDDVLQRHALHQHVEHALGQEVGVDPLAHGQVSLGIHVHRQDAVMHLAQGYADIEGRGRFGDPALLIGKG